MPGTAAGERTAFTQEVLDSVADLSIDPALLEQAGRVLEPVAHS